MKAHHYLLSLIAIICCACVTHAETNTSEANRVIEIELRSEIQYKNPFTEIEFDALVTQPNGKELRIPGFWAGGDRWCFRYASDQIGKHTWRTECSDESNAKLNGAKGDITVVKYQGNNPLYKRGKLRVTEDNRYFEFSDGTPFVWLGDTWWKGLCKRISFEGFKELTADRVEKGFTLIQIVCGTYPDELGLLKPSWENEGGMPYLKQDFSVVNPEYFNYADRRIEHLIDNGLTPAIVGGWGRAVTLNAVGLPGYKRHFRNLIARYGAYPVIFFVGGETAKKQGPWYEAAEYMDGIDPYNRLMANATSGMRGALKGSKVFDFDINITGHRSWETVDKVLSHLKKSYAYSPRKPFVSGESCYEEHMQMNPAYLQRNQYWRIMLGGAAGHTYGAAGIWHMGTPEIHGNWGGWGHQPYDLTTWREGMDFPGSAQLGRSKKLLATLPWQKFKPHPEWVGEDVVAAGIPGKIAVIYQPIRGAYKWDGIAVNGLSAGDWSGYYFDPVSGRTYDIGVHAIKGKWTSPNVPSPQDWVLVLEAQSASQSVSLGSGKVGETFERKLDPQGAKFVKKSGPDWLNIQPDGTCSGTPDVANRGANSFMVSVLEPGKDESLLQVQMTVLGADGELFVENFNGYKGTKNNTQVQTKLSVAHSGKVKRWNSSGEGAIHAVDRSFGGGEVTPSDWAVMFFMDNEIKSSGIEANEKDAVYEVSYELAPAVYAQAQEATREGDALLIQILEADGTVIKSVTQPVRKWDDTQIFNAGGFEYVGTGSGLITVQIKGAGNVAERRFKGALDNLVVKKK